MRYADIPGTEVEIMIAAEPMVVWELVSDINLPARFSEEFQGAEWLDEPGKGARFLGRNQRKQWEWTTTSTIVWFEPGERFGWIVEDAENPTATWRFDIEPADSGTRLRMSASMGPGPSGVSSSIERNPDREEEIVAGRLREWEVSMRATVEGIRGLAERR